MKFLNLTIFLVLMSGFTSAQNSNWGWGLNINTSLSGTTLTCTVFDAELNTTRTNNIYSVDNYINSDGVVATVTASGTVRGLTYDLNSNSWKEDVLSSNSGNIITNSDGVIAWVSAAGTVGGAIYDPDRGYWKDDVFSSNSGNSIINNDGVVAWVSSAGTVGGAVYDPSAGYWRDDVFSSNSGNSIVNEDGVVAWISSAGTIGGAVYDPSSGYWRDEVFSSSSSNSNLYISNGTVYWSSFSGSENYGFDYSSKDWKDGYNTDLHCTFFIEKYNDTDPHIVYFWCLSIGADSYSYNSGDGHTITRRWGFKQYANAGNYNPVLTIFNSVSNSTCSQSISVNTSKIAEVEPALRLFPNPANGKELFLQSDNIITGAEVTDVTGRMLVNYQFAGERFVHISDLNLHRGAYFVKVLLEDNRQTVRKLIVE